MPSPYVRYVLDPTGLNADNIVSGEIHELSTTQFRAVTPKYGAFFSDSLVITDSVSNRVLIKNFDYKIAELMQEASLRYGKEIAMAVIVINSAVSSSVRITYQVLGGLYQNNADSVVNMYNTAMADNRPIDWIYLLNKPVDYPPSLHRHYLEDIFGFETMNHALERIRNAIVLSNIPAFEAMLDWVNQRISNYSNVVNLGITSESKFQLMLDLPIESNPSDIEPDSYVTLRNMLHFRDFLMDTMPKKATLAEAQMGTEASHFMTPALVKAAIDTFVPSAQPTVEGTVKLNNGAAVIDSVDATKALTAAGLVLLLNKPETNALQEAVQAASPPTKISLAPGNMIDLREDGIYYGTLAEDNVADIYIDANDGDDAAIGSSDFPMKTIQAALARGKGGIHRVLRLRESQTHYVRPENPAIMRGGVLLFLIYGPELDKIPSPVGGPNNATEAALALGTTIQGTEFILQPADGSGTIYQAGAALFGIDGASVSLRAITLIPGRPKPDIITYPVSRVNASFSTYYYGASWTFYTCKLKTAYSDQRFFCEALYQPFSIFFLSSNYLEGPGVLVAGNSKLLTVSGEITGFTSAKLRSMINGTSVNSEQYSSFNTNLLPTDMPSYAARAWGILHTTEGFHGNVESYTIVSTGVVKVWFKTPMVDVNYAVIATISVIHGDAGPGTDNTVVLKEKTTEYFVVNFWSSTTSSFLESVDGFSFAVYR